MNGLLNIPAFLPRVCQPCFFVLLLSSFDIDFFFVVFLNLRSFVIYLHSPNFWPFFFICVDGSIVFVFGFIIRKTFFPLPALLKTIPGGI